MKRLTRGVGNFSGGRLKGRDISIRFAGIIFVDQKVGGGGLGIRPAKLINQASLMKVGWNLMAKKDDLWVKIIRAKYKCGDDLIPKINGEELGPTSGGEFAKSGRV